MAMADRVKYEDKEWGGKGITFVEIPKRMRLTSKDRREDSAILRERFTRNMVARGSIGTLS